MTTGNENEIVVWILMLMLVVTLDFLPTIIAFGSYRAGAIFALNLFLGWTLLGWLGALRAGARPLGGGHLLLVSGLSKTLAGAWIVRNYFVRQPTLSIRA